MDAEFALRATALTRSFSGRRVVDGVDLTVERGEIMGFLGPNGSGKTTFMNMATGLLEPDAGEIALLGVVGGARRREVRLRIGYLQEKPRMYPEMSARGYLRLFADLYGVPTPAGRVAAVLDRVGLGEAADRPLGAFSRGMQQRTCLARVMLHEPEFLMLDEPTLGLDPSGVADMRDILLAMRDAGTTLFFSSHQLAEMERICDRVAFMKGGRLIAIGKPADLLPDSVAPGLLRIETAEDIAAFIDPIGRLAAVAEARVTGPHSADIVLREPPAGEDRASRAAIARELTSLGLTVLSVSAAKRGLEDIFLALDRNGAGGPQQE